MFSAKLPQMALFFSLNVFLLLVLWVLEVIILINGRHIPPK